MQRIIITFLMMFMLMFSVNAVTFEKDLTLNQNLYEQSDRSYVEDVIISGTVNENRTTPENVSIIYDMQRFYPYISDDFYVIYDSLGTNHQIEIIITEQLTASDFFSTIYTITLNTTDTGKQYYRFVPEFKGEYFGIEVNMPDEYATNVITFATTENAVIESVDSITNTFVSSMKDLIDIVIGFWKMFYYLFIFSIILLGLGLLIGFVFKIYEWAEMVSERKKRFFDHSSRDK